jgi:hypothetical protein
MTETAVIEYNQHAWPPRAAANNDPPSCAGRIDGSSGQLRAGFCFPSTDPRHSFTEWAALEPPTSYNRFYRFLGGVGINSNSLGKNTLSNSPTVARRPISVCVQAELLGFGSEKTTHCAMDKCSDDVRSPERVGPRERSFFEKRSTSPTSCRLEWRTCIT